MKHIIIGLTLVSVLGIFLVQQNNSSPLVENNQQILSEKKDEKRFDQPDKAAQWLMEMRKTPLSDLNPSQLNSKFKREIETLELAKRASATRQSGVSAGFPKFKFKGLGPSNFGGRIRGFVIKTDDSNQLLAGGVSGGIWKSENKGQSWHATSDFLPTIAISSMIIDPDNDNRVFVGTGEGFLNLGAARGAGLFVSEDFGKTWNQLPSTNNSDFYYVNRMVRIPNSSILLAATRAGIFRSENLGQSWSEVSGFNTSSRGFVDLKIDPSDDSHLLTYHYGAPNGVFLNIVSPNEIAGGFHALQASFGPDFATNGTGNKNLTLVNDGMGVTDDACDAITNDLTGKIALAQRGGCNFTVKVLNAQNAGAVAVVIYQNTADPAFTMGADEDDPDVDLIIIPSVMILKANGEILVAESDPITVNIKKAEGNQLTRSVMESNNFGESWKILTKDNGLPQLDISRMEIAFGTDGVAYVMVANDDNATRGLWRSDGGNSNFSKTESNTAFIERQGWFNLAIAVHPNDSNTVYLGAIDQFVTHNGGNSIVQNSIWKFSGIPVSLDHISNYIHSDHHGYFFDPDNPSHHYIVGDGGVSKSEDNGATFQIKNNGLSISQSYGIAVSPDGKKITSGTQDNGTQIYFGDSDNWLSWFGGDGGYSAWDQQDGRYLYGSLPATGDDPSRILFGTKSVNYAADLFDQLPDNDGASFIEPFALDPNDGNRLILGTNNVFYTSNARSIQNATFTDVTGDLPNGSVRSLSFNQNISNQILVGMASGHIYKVDNIGTQNSVTDISASLSGVITDIKADPNDNTGKTLYATRANYNVERILRSSDGGNSWQSISGDLPNIPLFQVSIDPRDSNIIYVGSEMGLWVTNLADSSNEWTRYHYGLAYTRVIDLVWHEQDTLYVGTHGRGTFRATRNPLDISINKFITTDSSNDDDGILDNGESGQYLLNLTNNSGFEISDAELDISAQGLIVAEDFISIPNIPPLSSVVIPINATLANDTTCLSDTNFDIDLTYSDGRIQQTSLSVVTAANPNKTNTDFIADAESANSLMTTELLMGSSGWSQVTSAANSGSKSWFASDEFTYTDKSLISPWMVLDAGGNRLNFSLKYLMQGNSSQYKDGVVLELREKGGIWIDIGQFSTIAYDGQLFTNNTARARFAWSGSKNSWRQASVDLEDKFKGKTVQFRFKMVTDKNIASTGFWVDDITLSNVILDDKPSCDESVSTGGKIPSSGLWYDRSRSGHGFVIEPIGNTGLYFTVFYTYDDAGIPEWYTSLAVLEDGVLNLNYDANTLQRFIYDFNIDPSTAQANIKDPSITDGRLSIDFNSDNVVNSAACQDGTSGRPSNLVAVAKWKINDQQGSWCIEPIIPEQLKGFPDVGGTWFAGINDSGWGFSIASTSSQIISIIYYYDETGQPRWAIGQQGGFETGKDITIQMEETSGFGRTESTSVITKINAGTLKLNIQNVLNNIEIDGKANLNLEYQGVEGGQWLRNNVPVTILTNRH